MDCYGKVATAGGDFFPEEFGAGYVKALAQHFYGIPEFHLLKAAGLDVIGADVEAVMASAKCSEPEPDEEEAI